MKKINKLTPDNILAVVFVAVIFFFFFSVFVKFAAVNIQEAEYNKNNANKTEVEQGGSADWVSKYPFDEKYAFDYDKKAEEIIVSDNDDKGKYINTVNNFKNGLETYTTDLLFGRLQFVEFNAAFNKAIGMKLITGTDSVVIMNNGYLTFEASKADTHYSASSVKWFFDILEEKGINTLYVQCPSKENKFDNQLPDGVEDNYNLNADSLIEKLNFNDVNTLDLRPLLNEEKDYYSCFFKTDHHWTPQTGVWAAGKIAEALNGKFNYDIDEKIGNIENYNVDVYEDFCFGSQGKKVTLKYADPEDFSVVYPKEKTSFTVTYNEEKTFTAPYEKSFLNLANVKEIDYYNTSTYSTYLYGENSIINIHNNNVTNGKKLLYIGDSFNFCVVPALANAVEDMVFIDRRMFNGSIINYIEQYNPDTVIVSYNPSLINNVKTHNGTFNFE